MKFPEFSAQLWSLRRRVVATAALMLIHAAIVLTLPLPLKVLLDQVILKSSPLPTQIEFLSLYPDTTKILLLFFVFLALILVNSAVSFAMSMMAGKTGFQVAFEMRKHLLQRMFSAKQVYLERQTRAKWTGMLSGDLGNIQDVVVDGLFALVVGVPTLLAIVGILFFTSDVLGAVVFSVLICTLIFTVVLSKVIRRNLRTFRNTNVTMDDSIFQAVGAMPLIKTLVAGKSVTMTIEKTFLKSMLSLLSVVQYQSAYDLSLQGTRNLLRALVLLVGGWMVIHQNLSVGTLVLFISYVEATSQPLNYISKFVTKWNKTSVSLERVERYFLELSQVQEDPHGAPVSFGPQGFTHLEFRNVSFGYSDSKLLLNDFSHVLSAGQTVALAGPSGAGKSTVCHLLLRLLEPISGEILINGKSISSIELSGYRKTFSVVFQEPLLLNATIRENLLLGMEDGNLDDSALYRALEKVNAADFIQSLPLKLSTKIGEGGRKLSGGERQRLMLARAFLKPFSSVFIFDEPSTGLDPQSSQILFDSIKGLKECGALVILVTHRKNELQYADRVLQFPLLSAPPENVYHPIHQPLS